MKFSLGRDKTTGRYRYRFRPLGKTGPQESSPRFEKKADALSWLDLNQARIEARAKMRPGERLTLALCIERWLATGRGGEVYREKSRRTLLRLFTARNWTKPEQITRANVEPLTIDQRRLLLALVNWGIAADQPFDQRLLSIPTVPRPKRPEADLLTIDEVQAMLAKAQRWSYASMVLAHCVATYAHRPESLVRALVSDVDAQGRLWLWVKGRRGGDRIAHPVLPETMAMLNDITMGRAPDAHLFIGHDGEPWGTGQRFAQWWHHFVGAGVGIYRLKQYAVTTMLQQGLDVKTISKITGHRCPEVLLKYARTNATQVEAGLRARQAAGVPVATRPAEDSWGETYDAAMLEQTK